MPQRQTPHGTRFQKGQSGNPAGRVKGSKNKPKTLPLTAAVAAAELASKGCAENTIARMLDAKPEAVKEAIAQSRKLLELFAPQVAEHWFEASRIAAANGDHKPAMALLQSVESIKPIAQTYDTGNGPGGKAVAAVHVEFHGFGFAGLPQAQPAIDVKASTT